MIRLLLLPEALLARLVEHLTCKQKVVGSNPTLGRYFSTQVYPIVHKVGKGMGVQC